MDDRRAGAETRGPSRAHEDPRRHRLHHGQVQLRPVPEGSQVSLLTIFVVFQGSISRSTSTVQEALGMSGCLFFACIRLYPKNFDRFMK